ncbi:type VI secretion system contractile sheath large subunit [Acidocella sp.]|uniref:type VI secretion system contractile sheath large subunit n=1 Tax=Acidocella sp. TaxID=50710 RepID=UPI0026253D5E|nr:type VI secretion system contractile sheath large subunit [Acidocella sp.]
MTGDDEDSDATIIRRVAWTPPAAAMPAPPPEVAVVLEPAAEAEPIPEEPSPAPPPIPALRDTVLRGAYFTAAHAGAAAQFAAFIAARTGSLQSWFGSAAAPALARDPGRLIALLTRDIAAIDAMIARQLDAILHHQRLRRLEGSWRGLAWLASRLNITGRVKLRILNVTWAEICRDLERAAEFDQSQLFRSVYEDEFGTAGGEPYGLLVVDHEVRHRPGPGAITDDISALTSLARVAAAAFAPLVIGAAPALLGVDTFAELSGVGDPASAMSAAEYQRWRRLATLEDARFLAVTLPRTLARLPWQEELDRHRGFRYRETVSSPADRVFSTAGYLLAACVIRAFETYSWPADMRGYDIDRLGGGVVEDLPEPWFTTDPPDGLDRPALELTLTDRQERALVAAGLLPVSAIPFGGQALIGAARSLQTPVARFAGQNAAAAAEANARLSAQFNSMVCVARFAHYVKVMGRDMVGSFKSAAEVQRFLQDWLMRFANANTDAGPETMARYPLRSAAVTVTETLGKPGVFGCVVQLQPHFQLDDVAASFRLMTELSAPGKH